MRVIDSSHGSDGPPLWALVVLALAGVALAPTARAEEPGEILMRAISAGEDIVAGEVTITHRHVNWRDRSARELEPRLVGKFAFDIPNNMLRWSRSNAWDPRHTPQHIIEAESEHYYQQGNYLRIRLVEPKQLNREHSPIDVRIVGRAPLRSIADRDNLPKVIESLKDAKFRLMDKLKEDDESIARVVRVDPTRETPKSDKTTIRYHLETRYRIDTKRNVITDTQVFSVNDGDGVVTPASKERFTWEEIDGVYVPVKCEHIVASDGHVDFEYLLEWASVNHVNEARFKLSDLPPLSKDGVFIDDIERARQGIVPPKKVPLPGKKPAPDLQQP